MLGPMTYGILGSGARAATYATILQEDYGADEVFALVNISSATTIWASVNQNRNGIIGGTGVSPHWGLQDTAGPVPGSLAPYSDGTNDYGDILTSNGSDGLVDSFNGNIGSMLCFFKPDSVAVWADDSTLRQFIVLIGPGGNFIEIFKHTIPTDTIKATYRAGATSVVREKTGVSTTDWFSLGLSWKDANNGDEARFFYDGGQVGATLTGTGAWSGDLSRAMIAALDDTPTRVWHGWKAYLTFKFGSVWTPTQFQEMHDKASEASADFIGIGGQNTQGCRLDGADSRTVIYADGYSNSAVNQSTHREQAIITRTIGGTTYQVVCFWNDDAKMVIAIKPGSANWVFYTLDGTGSTTDVALSSGDTHKSCVLGVDPDGYIHISYDHHNEALNYRVSSNPIGSFDGSFGAETTMLGTNETSVSYPTFINDPNGTLYFIFRTGAAGNGNTYFYVYDESTGSWSAAPGTGSAGLLIDGESTRNAYQYFPRFDPDFGSGGHMHLAFSWREDAGGDNNKFVSYAKWDGTSWFQADGTTQTVPIKISNADVADNVDVTNGLTSMHGADSDGDGNPHIAYLKNDGGGNAQIYHVWHNGTAWQGPTAVTSQSGVESVGDDALAAYPYVKIAVSKIDGTAYIIHRGFDGGDTRVSHSSDYSTWTETALTQGCDNGNAYKPLYDRGQWNQNEKLVILVQPFNATDERYTMELVEWTP